jgi:hypothetical protein
MEPEVKAEAWILILGHRGWLQWKAKTDEDGVCSIRCFLEREKLQIEKFAAGLRI